MTTTSHLGITLVEQAQAQKEVTVNQALTRIDSILNTGAKSRTVSTPPGSPVSGDLYIVGTSPTGDWTGQAGKLTYYDQIWRFITPAEGLTLWVNDEDKNYTYDGSAWFSERMLIKQTLWVPASSMRQTITNGSTSLNQVEIAANQPEALTLDFDPSVEKYAQFSVAFKKGWNEGTVTAVFYWSHPSTTTNFAVVWGMQGVACSDADAMGVAFGTAQEVTDTGGTTNSMYVSGETSAITIGGSPAEGDVCFFRVYRKAASGSDTLAVNARLHGIKLLYTINTLDDM